MNLADLIPFYTASPASITKRRAVQIIVQAKLRAEGFTRRSLRGKGNKAAKRAAQADMDYENARFSPLTPAEVDHLAEQWSESRTFQPRRALVHP